MKVVNRTGISFPSLLLFGLLLGCENLPLMRPEPNSSPSSLALSIKAAANPEPSGESDSLATIPEVSAAEAPIADVLPAADVSVDWLVEQVLARNPSLSQMVATWQAASARYLQVTSLDDPMFGATFGPGSIGSNAVDFAYRLEIAQKYPFPGKLRLRGQAAQAETSAAGHDVEDMRLQLVESAKHAFIDYFFVDRALVVNEEALRLLKEFKGNAENRYKTNLASEQDVLQANVEVGRQQERQLLLERMRQVAVARINTLMHLPTNALLPPPPKEIPIAGDLPPVEVFQDAAVGHRPELQGLAERINAEEATLALAHKESCPDFEVMAAYDAFWQRPEQDLRAQVGVRINLPVRHARRQGAISEAEAKLAQRRAELEKQRDQINFQVQEAYAQMHESEQVIRLYKETVLPAAEANVQSAQAAYTTGKVPFLSLIDAQRNLVGLRDRNYEAIADYFRRRATLERVVGGLFLPTDTSPR